MSKRRNARELLLKVLFQIEVGGIPQDEVFETTWEQVRPQEEDREFVERTARAVLAESGRLDGIIAELAEGWRLERLAKVDKNVLRAALHELIHSPEVPVSVIVNDAVEIAKKYSTDDSGRFVNGILGSFLRRREEFEAGEDVVEIGTH
jgi:transcription antitermination protein NusB